MDNLELIQARERLHIVIAPMRCHAATKCRERQIGHDLRKLEHALMYGSLRRTSEKGTKSAPRHPNRDQTKLLVYVFQSSTYSRLS